MIKSSFIFIFYVIYTIINFISLLNDALLYAGCD